MKPTISEALAVLEEAGLIRRFASYHTIDGLVEEQLNDPAGFREHVVRSMAHELAVAMLAEKMVKVEETRASEFGRRSDIHLRMMAEVFIPWKTNEARKN